MFFVILSGAIEEGGLKSSPDEEEGSVGEGSVGRRRVLRLGGRFSISVVIFYSENDPKYQRMEIIFRM